MFIVIQDMSYVNNMLFHNSFEKSLTFDDVFERILDFIRRDPMAVYNLAIGSDSHAGRHTKFVTAIHLHRRGKGAWGCIRTYDVPRRITSLREKISTETALSQEVAWLFTPERLALITDILLPYIYKGADFHFEIHIDVGHQGQTRELIQEMVGRVEAMGLDAKIKPASYAASGYADRFTK